MNWFTNTLGSSIGKKLMMAITGLCFCGFLVVHLIGNLTLYGGKDFFSAYVEHLHSYGPLVTVAELGLLALAIIHVLTGLTLFFGNLGARPEGYKVNKNAGGRTIGSLTMPYTGILLLAFIVLHLIQLRFVNYDETMTVFQNVSNTLSQPAYVIIYIAAVIVAAIHVSHGFWSAFQTLGANHPKYMPLIQGVGIVFSLVVGIGFGLIPGYILSL
ncbi:succinate dehydrogenase cytochrome b subunit [Desulfobacterales bacterium HSG2]|nr:succinate dehydrogenase cytochrome b subunit [Desulfobacterales bacterium HSG2]